MPLLLFSGLSELDGAHRPSEWPTLYKGCYGGSRFDPLSITYTGRIKRYEG
jgi:hypothetical protein